MTSKAVIQNMNGRAAAAADRRLIRRGRLLWLISFVVFTAANVLQARTDAAFR
jgi:hypothetical protein